MNNALDKNIDKFFKGFLSIPNEGFSDPTYLGWKFVFDFNPTNRNQETGETDNPLFSENDSLESAIRYLKATGYPNRAIMLQKFKANLEYINKETPWYWQTLSGMQDLWKIEFGENFTPFRCKDKYLEIGCLESIDLRITALADLYRKATFDTKNMRSILPENLKWFTVTIQLAEMRSFQKISKAAATTINPDVVNQNPNTEDLRNNTKPGETKMEDIENLISLMEFKLSHCTFDFWSSFPTDQDIMMNGEANMAKQKFRIKVGRVQEQHSYKLLDLVLKDGQSQEAGSFKKDIPNFDKAFNPRSNNILQNNLNGVANQLQDRLNQIAGIPSNLIAKGVNKIDSIITSKQLGNAYDIRNQSVQTILNGFVDKAHQLGREDVYPNVPGSDLSQGAAGDLGNIYH